jgi:S-adenosylmethionine:tRNA ribosyltransferase-isomerase
MFNIEDYEYDLPEGLIAQVPALDRDNSRLLVIDRLKGSFSDHHFFDLPRILESGDLIVVNNTRVVPARLSGRKETGGRVEVLVLEHADAEGARSNTRWCLLKSSKRPKTGTRLFFEKDLTGLVDILGEDGLVRIVFQGDHSIDRALEEQGIIPLPPYIKRGRQNGRSIMDRERYQTVFSRAKGAVAAPTAGLHFTGDLVDRLAQGGITVVEITLHVGHGTFKPVRVKDIRNHDLGEESYVIDPEAAAAINRAKRERRRILAVGTTVVRTLETIAGRENEITAGFGRTDLLITPGFQFRVVDGLITNFHLPRSSLLFLVAAFAGLKLTREAYQWAVETKYRFYSYGDAMLII